jgi:hypothetical protein
MIALRSGCIELDCLMRKIDMIVFDVFGVESKHAKCRLLLRISRDGEHCKGEKCDHNVFHSPTAQRMEFLKSVVKATF